MPEDTKNDDGTRIVTENLNDDDDVGAEVCGK